MSLHLVNTARVWFDDVHDRYIVTDYAEWLPGRAIVGVVDTDAAVCIACGLSEADYDVSDWLNDSLDGPQALCPNCQTDENKARFDAGATTFAEDESLASPAIQTDHSRDAAGDHA